MMSGKKQRLAWYRRFPLALTLALAVALPAAILTAAPALAGPPDKGSGWKHVSTKHVKYFVANPAKPARGRWKLKSTNDRKYFMANKNIDARTEEEETGFAQKSTALIKVPPDPQWRTISAPDKKLDPIVRIAPEKGATKTFQQRNREGGSLATYQVSIKDTVEETKVPTKDLQEKTWEQFTRRTGDATYKITKHLTFKDAKTGQPIKTKHESSLTRGGIIKDSAREAKRDTQHIDGNPIITDKVVGASSTKKLIARSALAGADVGNAGLDGANLGTSGDTGGGSAAARISSSGAAARLAGAQKAQAGGGLATGVDTQALLQAAQAGATLYDQSGGIWELTAEGKTVVFSSGSGAIRLAAGSTEGKGDGGGSVRIDAASFGKTIALNGEFKAPGGDKASRVLNSR